MGWGPLTKLCIMHQWYASCLCTTPCQGPALPTTFEDGKTYSRGHNDTVATQVAFLYVPQTYGAGDSTCSLAS